MSGVLTAVLMLGCAAEAFAASDYGPGNERTGSASVMEGVTESMILPEFWASPDYKKLQMTPDEINAFNARNFAAAETKMVDLSAESDTYNGEAMKKSLAGFENPKGLFLDGRPVPLSYYDAIRRNINGMKAAAEMPVRYGIAIHRSVMKGLPYSEYLSDSQSDPDWDNLAASAVLVNEPLLVYGTTADGCFYYVQSEICAGWLPVNDVAICHSREEWLQAATHRNFLVVTGETITLEASAANPAHSEQAFDMGTVLELSNDVEMVDNRMSWYNYVVWVPGIGADGMYEATKALIPMSRDVHVGFLPFTQEKLIAQAMKCLGNRYGWGGMLDSQDCSAYVRELYLCFGMKLPRNTTWQAAMPVKIVSLEGKNDKERQEIFDRIPAGSIVQFPGHEMLYLGASGGNHYTINDVSSVVVMNGDERDLKRVRSVVINSMEKTFRGSGVSWLGAVTRVIIPWEN